MKKSNITITRYVDRQLGWAACVRPDDGEWVLFVPELDADGKAINNGPSEPQLWLRVGTCTDEHGDTHDAYARAGSEEHRAYVSDYGAGVGLVEASG